MIPSNRKELRTESRITGVRKMKAVIPAAGLGTRFLPATKAQPKEMLPVVDKPCIQYAVEEAVAAGITDIIIITGRGKRSIEDHFDKSIELEQRLRDQNETESLNQIQKIADMADIFYVRQKEPLGLGHAILCAKRHIGEESFAVLLGDDLILGPTPGIGQLIETYERYGKKSVIGVGRTARESLHKYGVIDGKELDSSTYLVEDIIEKPEPGKEPSDLAVIGRYIFTHEIFHQLGKIGNGVNGEIQLTDAIRLMLDKEKVFARLVDGNRFDLGTKLDWLKANISLALERPEIRDSLREWLNSYTNAHEMRPR